jgi:hypothetical protein
LGKLGWAEGRNIRIDNRWGAIGAESLQQSAKELVAQQPDLIFTQSTPTTIAVLQQTRTIPVLFVQVTDPVGQGIVTSLARPGGNVTGFTNFEPALAGKSLELLKEIAPHSGPRKSRQNSDWGFPIFPILENGNGPTARPRHWDFTCAFPAPWSWRGRDSRASDPSQGY